MEITLEEYREQRLGRERRRKDFIRRFEAVKARIGLREEEKPVQRPPPQAPPQKSQPSNSNEHQQLLAENRRIKDELAQVDKATAERMLEMKKDIGAMKETYTEQMEDIIKLSHEEKTSQKEKIESLMKQLREAIAKNKEIQGVNGEMREELSKGDSTFEGFSQDLSSSGVIQRRSTRGSWRSSRSSWRSLTPRSGRWRKIWAARR